MTALTALVALQTQGLALLTDIHASSTIALLDAGFALSDIKIWRRSAADYLGPTKSTAKQRDTLRYARDREHSLRTLVMINKHARKVGGDKGWALRVELTRMAASYEQIDAHAKKRVEELNDHPKKARTGFSKRTVDAHTDSITITGPSATITDLATRVRDKAGSSDPATMAAAFHELIAEGGVTPGTSTPMVIMRLDDALTVVGDTADGNDVLFARDDGARITGAEIVERGLADNGYIMLTHPMRGGVNLYHARFANKKQRLMAAAENPICPVPGCSTPAQRCQIHHLTAYKYTAETKSAELSTCCAFHNGRNDDNPNAPPRNGKLVRGPTGWIGWQYQPGSPIHYNAHPTAQLGAMRIV